MSDGTRPALTSAELTRAQAELEDASPEEILRWARDRFGRLVIVASLQAESSVLIDIASHIPGPLEVLTLDTGRLPQETHDVIDQVRERYGIRVRILTPDPAEVAEMTGMYGTNLFRQAPSLRRHCCEVRKTNPLRRALGEYDAWITGLRRDQSPTRAQTPVVAIDEQHGGIAKIAPLVRWTKTQVWDYIHDHQVPHHPLYAQGYTSIGCAPCTRATAPGEDERAGRWWWEQGEIKECGLHVSPAPQSDLPHPAGTA